MFGELLEGRIFQPFLPPGNKGSTEAWLESFVAVDEQAAVAVVEQPMNKGPLEKAELLPCESANQAHGILVHFERCHVTGPGNRQFDRVRGVEWRPGERF